MITAIPVIRKGRHSALRMETLLGVKQAQKCYLSSPLQSEYDQVEY